MIYLITHIIMFLCMLVLFNQVLDDFPFSDHEAA